MAEHIHKTPIFAVVGYGEGKMLGISRCFEQMLDATAFLSQIRKYEERRPQLPGFDVGDENHEEYERWWRKFLRWQQRHPAGGSVRHADHFDLMKVTLFAKDQGQTNEAAR